MLKYFIQIYIDPKVNFVIRNFGDNLIAYLPNLEKKKKKVYTTFMYKKKCNGKKLFFLPL